MRIEKTEHIWLTEEEREACVKLENLIIEISKQAKDPNNLEVCSRFLAAFDDFAT